MKAYVAGKFLKAFRPRRSPLKIRARTVRM